MNKIDIVFTRKNTQVLNLAAAAATWQNIYRYMLTRR